MFCLCPLSSFKQFLWPESGDSCVGLLKDKFYPYVFGRKPTSTDKNYLGNRDCMHVQLHGNAVINDIQAKMSNSVPVNDWTTRYGYDYCLELKDTSNRSFKITKVATVDHPIDDMRYPHTVVSDVTVPLRRCCYIHDNVAVRMDIRTGVNTSLGGSNYYLLWRYDFRCAIFLHGVWRPIQTDEVDLNDYPLPEGCSWRSSKFGGTGALGLTSSVTYAQIDTSYHTIEKLKDSYPEFLEDLLKEFCQRLALSAKHGKIREDMKMTRNMNRFMPGGKITYLKSSFLSSIKRQLYALAEDHRPKIDLKEIVGRATQSAADAARDFEGNTGTLINELVHLKGSLIDLYKMLQGEVNLKNVSSLFLTGKYGLRLTVQDTAELARSVLNKVEEIDGLYSVARGSHTTDEAICRCKLYYDQDTADKFSSAMFQLQSWDLFPSFQNVWDIVPYSFVADWFVDIEGYLSAIDTRTFMSTMNVFNVLYSVKQQWEFKHHDITCINAYGFLSFSSFTRWSESEAWPVIPSFSGGQPSDHIIEGTALILQRL